MEHRKACASTGSCGVVRDTAKFDQASILVKDQKATVQVTFPKPGTYILRGTANDGELKVEKDVTVTVR